MPRTIRRAPFFVVYENSGGEQEPVVVSADWKGARAYARKRSAQVSRDAGLPVLSERSEGVVSGTMKKGPVVVASGID